MFGPRLFRPAAAAGVVIGCISLFGCSAPSVPVFLAAVRAPGVASLALRAAPAAELPGGSGGAARSAASGAAPAVSVRWASTDYAVREPEGAAVALRVVVGNATHGITESTAISWDPSFAHAYTLIHSVPAAWRVSTDEAGWGVLDTEGTRPDGDTTFQLWFAANPVGTPAKEAAPQVRIVADGTWLVGEVRANAVHDAERARLARQTVFDRGLAARAADRLSAVPADSRGFFRVGVAFGVALLGVAAAGGAAAFRST